MLHYIAMERIEKIKGLMEVLHNDKQYIYSVDEFFSISDDFLDINTITSTYKDNLNVFYNKNNCVYNVKIINPINEDYVKKLRGIHVKTKSNSFRKKLYKASLFYKKNKITFEEHIRTCYDIITKIKTSKPEVIIYKLKIDNLYRNTYFNDQNNEYNFSNLKNKINIIFFKKNNDLVSALKSIDIELDNIKDGLGLDYYELFKE